MIVRDLIYPFNNTGFSISKFQDFPDEEFLRVFRIFLGLSMFNHTLIQGLRDYSHQDVNDSTEASFKTK